MSKIFNTAANCIPQKHYMVDLTGRLEQIKVMVDRGDYFTINRARQYGKTTTLMALAEYLKKDYLVVSLDFQELDESDWQSIADFVSSFAEEVLTALQGTESFPDRAAAWTKDGVVQAVGIILTEKNTLFDSLIDKVNRYPDLRECLYAILMKGSDMSYSPDIETIDVAQMYGFVKIVNSKVVIANRIFETRLYNFFLISEEANWGE